jgi:6-pyruvoyl-tetrahydropterin synthase
MHFVVIIAGILLIAIIAILIWVAISVSAAYQQTLVIEVPFDQTYRYVPHFNAHKRYQVDKIKVTVTGRLKLAKDATATITPGIKIKDVVKEHITEPYKNCLLIEEMHTFLVEETVLKRCPMTKSPTVENLSVVFFNKLATVMPEVGAQLVSVKLVSGDTTVTHSRYTMSNFSV